MTESDFFKSLQALMRAAERLGLNPVFTIVKANGEDTINMFTKPGQVTDKVLATWIKQLTKDGVPKDGGGTMLCANMM